MINMICNRSGAVFILQVYGCFLQQVFQIFQLLYAIILYTFQIAGLVDATGVVPVKHHVLCFIKFVAGGVISFYFQVSIALFIS